MSTEVNLLTDVIEYNVFAVSFMHIVCIHTCGVGRYLTILFYCRLCVYVFYTFSLRFY